MSLQDEIELGSREIATDGYPMSIGEILNLYRDGELDLHPEFQRFFRWKPAQKSKLIESILLGIPLPSVFVFQRADGVWDVIDGLQRLSTILEFAGELKDETGTKLAATELLKTRYLPSLERKMWQSDDVAHSLTDIQRRLIKRSKIDVKIIKSDSSETSKYELFQRLNTGGSIASDQEVRNCLLIMNNREMFVWLEGLAREPSFKTCTALTPRQLEERYDLELILRFMVMKDLPKDELKFEDIGDFLTERMLSIANEETLLDQSTSGAAFRKTFDALVSCGLEDDAFRKFSMAKNKFLGSFSISSFEAVAIGLGYRFSANSGATAPSNLVTVVKDLWENSEFTAYSGSGVRANLRVPHVVPLGRSLFS